MSHDPPGVLTSGYLWGKRKRCGFVLLGLSGLVVFLSSTLTSFVFCTKRSTKWPVLLCFKLGLYLHFWARQKEDSSYDQTDFSCPQALLIGSWTESCQFSRHITGGPGVPSMVLGAAAIVRIVLVGDAGSRTWVLIPSIYEKLSHTDSMHCCSLSKKVIFGSKIRTKSANIFSYA